ncbi:hypothetical protein Ahy_A02g009827 [Arachis hypogaea]|uniref:Uncharacterized protein n=1 Tax=Arachis hypogaea TaxID=3818 RepID=A0A445EI85_ARAHY|nr:hypothetical protein Ahy_A02g009827 [Arachis hypogaea]
MVHPSQAASKGPIWKDLTEPGVKHELIVGIRIQILQQATTTHHDSCVDHLAYAFGCWKHLRVQLHHEFNSKFIEGIIKLD